MRQAKNTKSCSTDMPCKKRVSADTLFCVSTAATDCKNKERKKTEHDAEAACLLTFTADDKISQNCCRSL